MATEPSLASLAGIERVYDDSDANAILFKLALE